MNISDEEILRQLELGEDSYWEFKRIKFSGTRPTSPKRNDLADEIGAFANARGGVLLCGVTDHGDVQRMSRDQLVALDSFLTEISSTSITPAVRISTSHRELPDGRRFVVVEIPQGESQHDSPGGTYVRVGGSKRKMTSDERLRLAQRRAQSRFKSYDELPVPGTGFKTLDESLWMPLLSAEGAANPRPALEKLGVLAADESGTTRATVAGVLLCTHRPEALIAGACITATRYRGRDRTSGQIDAQTITGPLDRQIANAVAFAIKNMLVAARKEPGRVDVPEYGEMALFEAIVNAVVHRDYSIHRSRIRLSIFEDRLELQSPGSLPNNLTVETMELRQATRNEALASLLGRMTIGSIPGSHDRMYFLERRGDGVPIIRRETRALTGRVPEFRLIDESELLLILPAARQDETPARAVVTVRSAARPLPGAELLLLFPNGTAKRAQTDEYGEASINLHTTHLPLTVFVAAPSHAAHLVRDWVPQQRALAVELDSRSDGGSAIFPEGTGNIPGFTGRLNPMRDPLDRTYLYASNIAIDEGRQQPVQFVLGEELRLTDLDGQELLVRILAVVGRAALVEYRPFRD